MKCFRLCHLATFAFFANNLPCCTIAEHNQQGETVIPINFHAPENRYIYATRNADPSWSKNILSLVDPYGKTVLDIGCGGGIYAQEWLNLGAKQVTGIDFSEETIQANREDTKDFLNLSFQVGDALDTGLPDACSDIVFERALIHHIPDLASCFREAGRLLKSGGMYLIQDRTMEDIQVPGSDEHIRGYFFDQFPKLLEIERKRRPSTENVHAQLEKCGFRAIKSYTFWETRAIHPSKEPFLAGLKNRKGRSILFDLTDAELTYLVDAISEQLPANTPITEKDRWTCWMAQKG